MYKNFHLKLFDNPVFCFYNFIRIKSNNSAFFPQNYHKNNPISSWNYCVRLSMGEHSVEMYTMNAKLENTMKMTFTNFLIILLLLISHTQAYSQQSDFSVEPADCFIEIICPSCEPDSFPTTQTSRTEQATRETFNHIIASASFSPQSAGDYISGDGIYCYGGSYDWADEDDPGTYYFHKTWDVCQDGNWYIESEGDVYGTIPEDDQSGTWDVVCNDTSDTTTTVTPDNTTSTTTTSPAGNATSSTTSIPDNETSSTSTTIPDNDTTITTTTVPCPAVVLYGEGSEEVELVREFRDTFLCTTPEGQVIISLYYTWSAEIIHLIESNKNLKKIAEIIIKNTLCFFYVSELCK